MAPKMNKSDWYDSDSDTLAESLWGKTTKDVSNKHNNKAPDQKIIRYKGYMVSKGLTTSGKQPSWSTAEFRDLPFDNAKLKQMVEAYYSRTGKGLAHNYKNLTPSQQRAVNRVVDEQIKKETNSRVEWTLECVRVARIKQHTWSAPEIKSIEVILKSQERATYSNRKANLNQDFLSYGDDDWLDLKVPPKKTKGVANSKAKTAKGAVRAMPGSKKMQNLDFSSDYEDYNLPKDPFMMPLGVGPKPQQNFSKPMNPVGSGLGPSFGPNQGGQPNFNNFGPGPGPHNLPANALRPMGGPNGPAMNGPPPGAFSNGLAGNLPKAPLPAGMFPDVPMGPSLNAGPPNAGPPNMGPPNAGQAGPCMGPPPNGLPPGAIHINDFPGGARGQGLNGPQTNLPFDRPFVNPANNGFNPARPQPPVNYRSDRLRSDSPEYRSGRARSRSHHDRYESRSRDHSRNGSRDRSYRRNSYRDPRSRTRSHDRSLPRRRDSTSNRQLRRIQRTMDTFADKLDALDINNASDSSSYHDSVFEHSSAYLSTPGTTPELAPRSLDGGRGRRVYTKASRPHLRRVLIEPAVSRGPGLPRSRRSPAYIDYQPARPPLQRRMTVSGQPTLRPRVHKSYDVDDYPYEAIEGSHRRGSLFESDAWAPHRTREQDWRRGELMGQSRYYN